MLAGGRRRDARCDPLSPPLDARCLVVSCDARRANCTGARHYYTVVPFDQYATATLVSTPLNQNQRTGAWPVPYHYHHSTITTPLHRYHHITTTPPLPPLPHRKQNRSGRTDRRTDGLRRCSFRAEEKPSLPKKTEIAPCRWRCYRCWERKRPSSSKPTTKPTVKTTKPAANTTKPTFKTAKRRQHNKTNKQNSTANRPTNKTKHQTTPSGGDASASRRGGDDRAQGQRAAEARDDQPKHLHRLRSWRRHPRAVNILYVVN